MTEAGQIFIWNVYMIFQICCAHQWFFDYQYILPRMRTTPIRVFFLYFCNGFPVYPHYALCTDILQSRCPRFSQINYFHLKILISVMRWLIIAQGPVFIKEHWNSKVALMSRWILREQFCTKESYVSCKREKLYFRFFFLPPT